MKLRHKGYLFFQPKRNFAFHFPFLTVTENSALCIQIQITELRITSFIENDSASAHLSVTINFYSFWSSCLAFFGLCAFVWFFTLWML